MKKNILYLSSLMLLFSCGETIEKENISEEESSVKNEKVIEEVETKEILATDIIKNKEALIKGYYVGGFEAAKYKRGKNPSITNKITICLDSISNETIFGHSIVAGNARPFTGSIDVVLDTFGIGYSILAKEPGDDKYDGEFKFVVNTKNETIAGTWKSFNDKLAVTERIYKLTRGTFRYNAAYSLPRDIEWEKLYAGENFDEEVGEWESTTADVLKYNASTTLLTKENIENMFQGDLEVLRNSIYARHGYSFKHRRMRYVFDKIHWYIPVSNDIRLNLTEIEKKNIDLIKRYEKHAEAYYDSYGR